MTRQQHIPTTFDGLLHLIQLLRNPENGCPWDRAQTHISLRPTLLEECYETLEAVDQGEPLKLAEELGDLLLQVVFHAQIADENGEFTTNEIFRSINDKLIRRHPHVFGQANASSATEVEIQWEEIKRQERGEHTGQSLLDGLPREMPALAYSQALQQRAARVGFDWEKLGGVLAKIDEEQQELLESKSPEEMEAELGDLLFSIVNLSRWLKTDAESALRGSAYRFYQRFRAMEDDCQNQGVSMSNLSMKEKDALWQQAKHHLQHG